MCITFIVPLSQALKLVPLLRKNGYWFVLCSTEKCIDYEMNDVLLSQKRLISEEISADNRYCKMASSFDDFLLGKGWYVYGDRIYSYQRMYYLAPSHRCGEPPEGIGSYIDPKLIKGDNPLVTITVEDPDVERKTLYKELVRLFESISESD